MIRSNASSVSAAERAGRKCLNVPWSVFITTVTHGRTAEPTKITFGVKTHVGPRDHVFGWGCSLVSPGEYDGSLAGAMAVHAVASITVATVQPAVNWSECNSSTLV